MCNAGTKIARGVHDAIACTGSTKGEHRKRHASHQDGQHWLNNRHGRGRQLEGDAVFRLIRAAGIDGRSGDQAQNDIDKDGGRKHLGKQVGERRTNARYVDKDCQFGLRIIGA